MKIAFIIFISSVTAIISAEVLYLDIESAVKMAFEHNLDIAAQEASLSLKQKVKASSWNTLLPSLDVKSGLGYSADLLNPGQDSPFDLSFGMQAGLTLSAESGNVMRQAMMEYELGLIDLDTTKRKIELNVRKTFFNILLGTENAGNFESSIATAQKRYDDAEKKFQAGRISELDTLQALADLENLNLQYDAAASSNSKNKMQFCLLLGLEPSAAIQLEGSLATELLPLESDKIISWFMANRSDLRSQKISLELLENQKDLVVGQELLPSFSISGSITPGINAPFTSDWGNGDNWTIRGSVGLSMTLPLDSWAPGSTGRIRIENAENLINLKKIEIRKLQRQGEADIRSLLFDIQKNRQAVDLLKKSVFFAQKVNELTEREYNAGTKDLLSVQETYQELLKARLDLSTANYNYRISMLDLEYALNARLTDLQALPKE